MKHTPNTTVLPIDWKESFSYHPYIVIHSETSQYRIICKSLSDNGETLTILPSLSGSIDDMLHTLEGCLNEESNFRQVLKEYYGPSSEKLKAFSCDFNGINLTLEKGMTAMEAKLIWLKNALTAGYHNLLFYMSAHELEALRNDPCMESIDSEIYYRVYGSKRIY